MGLIALILAILAFIFVMAALGTLPIGLVVVIIAIVLGILAIRRKRQRTLGIIALVLGGIAIVILPFSCLYHGATYLGKKIEETEKKAKEEAKTVNIGEGVKVGEVRWKVLSAEKRPQIEREFGEPIKPNGIFVFVKAEAELLTKEDGTIYENQFKIVDDKGRNFDTDLDATVALSVATFGEKETTIFAEQLHPNVPKSGWVVFDIATDATGLRLRIDDARTFSEEHAFVNLGI